MWPKPIVWAWGTCCFLPHLDEQLFRWPSIVQFSAVEGFALILKITLKASTYRHREDWWAEVFPLLVPEAFRNDTVAFLVRSCTENYGRYIGELSVAGVSDPSQLLLQQYKHNSFREADQVWEKSSVRPKGIDNKQRKAFQLGLRKLITSRERVKAITHTTQYQNTQFCAVWLRYCWSLYNSMIELFPMP